MALRAGRSASALHALKSLSPVPGIESEPLESWRLEPDHPDWARGLCETWTPGETAAQARLKRFLRRWCRNWRACRSP